MHNDRMMLNVPVSAVFALSHGSSELKKIAEGYNQQGNESAAGALREISRAVLELKI